MSTSFSSRSLGGLKQSLGAPRAVATKRRDKHVKSKAVDVPILVPRATNSNDPLRRLTGLQISHDPADMWRSIRYMHVSTTPLLSNRPVMLRATPSRNCIASSFHTPLKQTCTVSATLVRQALTGIIWSASTLATANASRRESEASG